LKIFSKVENLESSLFLYSLKRQHFRDVAKINVSVTVTKTTFTSIFNALLPNCELLSVPY